MFETAIVSITTFFATIGPIDVAAMFAALTPVATSRERRTLAIRASLIAAGILLTFALIGEFLLKSLGISLAALRTSGGVLLLLMAVDMVFARSSGGTSTTEEEVAEATTKRDIAVFPLATPLIAGPGAMGAVILLMANAEGNVAIQATVIFSLIVMLVFTLMCLLLAGQIHKMLGVTGMHVVTRVIGVLLAALAVQFVFDGIGQSGIFKG
ncbi:MarC family protein [Teredinibacter haidensis]|uniref:MarC family protein n=1 Tax=Teredinibacter haidensis TaxID=2731755 RepID=UPI000949114A|nr:MarC family protein [Teredinibacter haidensis]